MSAPIISVRDVSKRYRLGQIGMTSFKDEFERFLRRFTQKDATQNSDQDYWALRDINFDIYPGEVVGIIGRNGAGKSTLLKVLSRITEPTTGEIALRGRVGSLLEVGTGFHPDLSGRENVFLNGAILGMSKAEIAKKFDEIVAFSEVGKFIDTPVKRYSSGMYVRLAFAIAAHLEPEILIVDEVLAVGDATFQEKCLGKMERISKGEKRTILFVSHNMTAIRRLCTRCILLERGKPSVALPIDEAVERYSKGHTLSAHTIDVSNLERLGKQGRTARMQTISALGEVPLAYGKPATIEVTFDLTEPTQGVMIGIGFDTLEGQRLLSLDSDTNCLPWNLPAGRHTARIGLDYWPLQPGSYKLGAAVFVGHNCLDSFNNGAIWEVQTSNVDNLSDRGFGGVRLKPTATISSS